MSESLEDFNFLLKDPKKTAKSLVRKITHCGDVDLDKDDLKELKSICRASNDELMNVVFEECMKSLRKDHAQVRVSTLKLLDFLFLKSHIIRAKLLDEFDAFLELTLAISQKSKVKLKLPPPKKHAALLLELTAKLIHQWHAEYGAGYEKLRYAYKFLKEHKFVDFSQFQVRTREQLIQQQKLAERQERILTMNIENRLKDLQTLKPEIERIIAEIESLLDILVPTSEGFDRTFEEESGEDDEDQELRRRENGIANLSQRVEIEFSPYVEVVRSEANREIVQNLRELKKQLVESKLTKLIAIEKTLVKRTDQLTDTIKDIINLKNRSMNVVLKLGELQIIDSGEDKKNSLTLDNADSNSDSNSEFEEVEPKGDLETYIPKKMRLEYGLESIDPRELDGGGKVTLTDHIYEPSTSGYSSLSIPCNFRLENGKLCPRRDKIKCPFHGKIIPRDHNGIPLDDEARIAEDRNAKRNPEVPEWQDPEFLREIKEATGVDLTMPVKGKKRSTAKNLADVRTCDLTPKQRLQRKLKSLKK